MQGIHEHKNNHVKVDECSADLFLNAWQEKKRLKDSKLKAAKLEMLSREVEIRAEIKERRRQAQKIHEKEERKHEVDRVLRKDDAKKALNECCEIVVECEDEELLNETDSFQGEPSSSRTVSFTLPRSRPVVKEKIVSSVSQPGGRASVLVTSGGLIILMICAALVTASFILSPLIETMFSKWPFQIIQVVAIK